MVLRTLLTGLLAITAAAAQSSGLIQQYCSSQNTAGDYQGVYDMYQSNGLCKTQCETNYAYAVVQGSFCWCSNYTPSNTVDVSKCSDICPGFPTDLCGNFAQKLYGYVALTKRPIGIVGAARTTSSVSTHWTPLHEECPTDHIHPRQQPDDDPSFTSPRTTTGTSTSSTIPAFVRTFFTRTSSSSTSLSPPPSPPTQTTNLLTVLPQAPSSSTSPSSTSQPQAETSTSTTSTSSSSSSSTSIFTSAIVVTVSGAVVTQTVTSTPVPNPAQDAGTYTVQSQGLSAGAIAGIVIGVVAGVLALLLAAFLLYRRKQKREKEEAVAAAAAGRAMAEKKQPPRRNTSVLSKSGLLGGGTYDENANPFDEPTAGTASQRASMLFGAGAAAEATSPLGSSHSDNSRRHSKPMVYDQRLNPSALFGGGHDNGSRVSMQDGADYSRTLGVTNPDPRASWESRVSR